MVMLDDRFIATGGGASADVLDAFDDDPTWQQSTVPSSEHAANSGSHARVWMLGMPRPVGFSENVTGGPPLPARGCASWAAPSAANSGRIPHGMNRAGGAPPPSSTC